MCFVRTEFVAAFGAVKHAPLSRRDGLVLLGANALIELLSADCGAPLHPEIGTLGFCPAIGLVLIGAALLCVEVLKAFCLCLEGALLRIASAQATILSAVSQLVNCVADRDGLCGCGWVFFFQLFYFVSGLNFLAIRDSDA